MRGERRKREGRDGRGTRGERGGEKGRWRRGDGVGRVSIRIHVCHSYR